MATGAARGVRPSLHGDGRGAREVRIGRQGHGVDRQAGCQDHQQRKAEGGCPAEPVAAPGRAASITRSGHPRCIMPSCRQSGGNGRSQGARSARLSGSFFVPAQRVKAEEGHPAGIPAGIIESAVKKRRDSSAERRDRPPQPPRRGAEAFPLSLGLPYSRQKERREALGLSGLTVRGRLAAKSRRDCRRAADLSAFSIMNGRADFGGMSGRDESRRSLMPG
jgi:hypothetical protein